MGASREDSEGFLSRIKLKSNGKGGGASREDSEGSLKFFYVKLEEEEEAPINNSDEFLTRGTRA